jgi:hypothetical protein
MTITALPPAPSRADPANFATKADALLGAFDTFVSETNTTAANVDTKNTNVNTKSTNVDTKSALVDGYAVSALASKNSATTSESTATTNAATTSSKATTATAKALEASNSAASALSSKNAASNLALNVASTRASIRPTLLLDFASTKKLDSRVTFARSSTATVFDERGVMQTVASGVPRFDHNPVTGESLGLLMEESRTNLFTYSDRFDNSYWFKSAISLVLNSIIAPDGSLTATKIIPASGSLGYITPQAYTYVAGVIVSASIYARAGELSSFSTLITSAAFGGADGNRSVIFDLVSETATSSSNSGVTGTIKNIGGGWFKCTTTLAPTVTSSTSIQIVRALVNGDGVSGIYIWRAGLEVGAFPTSSIETPAVFTGRSSTATFIGSNGLIQTAASGVARYQYTPSSLTIPPYLLLESAGTNLLLNSATLAPTMGVTVTQSSAVGPAGVLDMPLLVEDTTTGEHFSQESVSVVAGNVYCFSTFIKDGPSANRDYWHRVYLTTISANFRFNPRTKVISAVQNCINYGYEEYPNGIFRVWLIYTPPASGNALHRSHIYFNDSTVYTGDGVSGILVVNRQLEQSDRPTTYIPTTTAQVTRAADTSTSSQVTRAADSALMTGVNFSSWYRQDEGTLFIVSETKSNASFLRIASITNGASSVNERYISESVGTARAFIVQPSGTISFTGASWSGFGAAALAYKTSDSAFSFNGSLLPNSSEIPSTVLNTLSIGSFVSGSSILNGTIKKLAFYPKRLSNIELVGLTS